MGIPGRKPKPKRVKEMEGNPDAKGLPPEPFEDETGVDTSCPVWLDKYGREFWQQYVPKLTAEGLFKSVDRPAFETMCDCYSQFRKAQAVIDEKGMTFQTPNGYVQQRPEVSIANKAKEQLRMLFAEFGMSASSRTRIGANRAGGGGDDEDWSGTGLDG